MTDASIIALYLKRSEQAIAESQNAYGRYCYRVAEGILNDASDSEESVNDTWLAAWDSIPPTLPQSLRAYLGTLTRRTKPSQFVVYLPDELYEKVLQLMTSCGFASVQEFLETSLSGIVEDASKSEMV